MFDDDAIPSPPVPARPVAASPVPASVELLHEAADGVRGAGREHAAPRRLALAHLAALRGAAAVLAARARPGSGSGPRDAWALLGSVAPELGEWARFFAGWSPGRGESRPVSARDADDMVRQVEQFLTLAEVAVRGAGPRSRLGTDPGQRSVGGRSGPPVGGAPGG